jgi:beta-glucosidase
VNDLLQRMTLEEKLDMLSGTGFESKPLPRLGIPSLDMTDGPVGVRWKESVALPASIMLAATFDTSLAYAMAGHWRAKQRRKVVTRSSDRV